MSDLKKNPKKNKMADWSWLLPGPFWLSQMGTGGLPDEFPSAMMAVVFGGRGVPSAIWSLAGVPETEKRDKIHFNHKRILAALLQYLIF